MAHPDRPQLGLKDGVIRHAVVAGTLLRAATLFSADMAAEDPEKSEDPKKKKAREFHERTRGTSKSTARSRDNKKRDGELKKGHR